MQAVALIGNKNSGKTSLMLRLIDALTARGMRVAAAKFTHHSLDRQGSDTEQLSRKAHCVVGLGQEQTSLFWRKGSFLADLLPLLDSDVLLIEGGRHLESLPRIILPRDASEVEDLSGGLALAAWAPEGLTASLPAYQDIDDLAELIRNRAFILPGLDCQACGFESCARLARAILQDQASAKDCQAVSQEMSILVNGQPIALNPFVRSIISGSILGMLTSLKGFAPGSIDIHLD